MALNIADKTVFWGAVASNYFWGKRSGMLMKDTNFPGHICNAFKIKRGSHTTKSNSGPTGRKARRISKNYTSKR